MSDDIYLSRLFYASTATDYCSPIEISKILAAGQKNNPALEVTGVLYFENNHFLQCLEGSRKNINFVFNKITDDRRHSEVQLLELKEIRYRYFEYFLIFPDAKSVVDEVMKEKKMMRFNPYLLDSRCLTMLAQGFSDIGDPSNTAKKLKINKKKKSFFDIFKRT